MKEAEIRPVDLFNRYLQLCERDISRFFSDRSVFIGVPCPACGSKDRRPGLTKLGFDYVTCTRCRSLYASPRPSREQLALYYLKGESVQFWSTDFYRQTSEARREKIFRPRAHLIGELDSHSPGGVFADIGAGFGILLEEVDKLDRFAAVMGIEPSAALARDCRSKGFQIIEKSVEEVRPDELRADFLTAFEVMEHVFDPLTFLSAAASLLKPGGQILFTTLTVSGFDIQVLWEASKSVHPPHHLNLLSVEGMEQLVERAGLRLVDLSTPGQLDVDIVANMQAEVPGLPLPRFVEYLLEARGPETRQAFQSFLVANRLSSHIRVVARSRATV